MFVVVLCAAAGLTGGCDTEEFHPKGPTLETQTGARIVRMHDPELVARGRAVFAQHCARCHGAQAEGAPDWRRRGPGGLYPPPPLDGSGHAWHHASTQLKDIIRNGSPPGQGGMPAWKDKLSEEEIDAAVEWFQSLWPNAVYAAWWDTEQRSLGRRPVK